MESPFYIKVRRGTAPTKVLVFYKEDGKTLDDVSALAMTLNAYTFPNGVKTLAYTRALANTGSLGEKSVVFLATDCAAIGNTYLEVDVGANPPTDGAWGYLQVGGK